MKTYIATVKILIAAPNRTAAEEIVSEILQPDDWKEGILDWSYLPKKDGKHLQRPTKHRSINLRTYQEGDFMKKTLCSESEILT